MTEGDFTCGKCGEILIIDAAHVTFKGGKKAYIRCDKCNSVRRIAYNAVEQLLKSNSEAVKPVKPETTEKEQENNAPEGVIWGAIAAVLAVIVSIVGILWYWYKNRKEGEAT